MTAKPTAKEIRQSFLDFFRDKVHVIVPSAPVVLPSDPTLLFVNAGMNPFKEIFLGAARSEAGRVANTQKCIRVSGKHNDLEQVGRDTYHHTFFEMLGNWSFGDYYKPEAIAWAWELLTKVWGLPRARLWVTVYRDDDEAEQLWRTTTDVPADHVLRFDEKDNFWEMGETGPCGPCSEIHVDLSPEGNLGPECVNADDPRMIEIWNLVFIQFSRREDGRLDALPARHVDTGMGLERITAVLQGCASNYDTDLFQPLIQKVAADSGIPYEGDAAVAMRVIADHVRALSLAMADGVLPSNEGRGYVLRRLLRRAVRFGRTLGLREPFLASLLPVLEEQLGEVFPELGARRDLIARTLRTEEESFAVTLDRGLALFSAAADQALARGDETFPGDEAFRLYDTYGFPLDLTELMAAERGLQVDGAGFETLMQQQRDRARSARRTGGGLSPDLVGAWVTRGFRSEFTGYDGCSGEARVTVMADAEGTECSVLEQGSEGYLLLTATPFYAESGGQVGDRGAIAGPEGSFEVLDTIKPAEGLLLHRGRVTNGRFEQGQQVKADVDSGRRARTARHHTATHLLNHALRTCVSSDIRQAGSYVAPDRLRFDFNHGEALSPEQLQAIERQVNENILGNVPVRSYSMALKDIQGSGIIAVFDEKYGEQVRVLDVGGFSRELCGGTHVQRTGDIGSLRIVSESSIAAGVRRIEAVCGWSAYEWGQREHALLQDLSRRLSVTAEALPERIDQLLAEQRRLEKALKESRARAAEQAAGDMLTQTVDIAGIPVLSAAVEVSGLDEMNTLGERLRNQMTSGVLLLGAAVDGKAVFYGAVTPDLQARIQAGKLVGQVARSIGGGGGGKPDRAQAGARDGQRLAEALAAVPSILEALLG